MAYFNCFYAKRDSAVPDGKTVTPTDDVQILLQCAGITNKSYTTLSELLADTTTLQTVISSNNAIDYLVRSTTWATDMCADSTAMSYIGLNNYASNTLLADSTWASAICNSTYFESVLNVKVPTMTSDTTPSGECSANSYYTKREPYRAFDNNTSSTWNGNNLVSAGQSLTGWIKYKFPQKELIKYLYFRGTIETTLLILEASNDDLTYAEIARGSSIAGWINYYLNFNNNNEYQYYKLTLTQKNTSGGDVMMPIATEIQFYGRADV